MNIIQKTFLVETCRFGIPFWPSENTYVLMPMPITDGRRKALKAQAKLIRANLEVRHYNSFKDFFDDNNIGTFENYFNIIRFTLRRSLVLLERNVDECFINLFHPWILGTMN